MYYDAYVTQDSKAVIFADDSNFFISSDTAEEAQIKGQKLIDNLNEWSQINDLIINTSKTQAIVFKAKGKQVENFCLKSGDDPVNFVDHVCLLGIIFSSDLSWNHHVNALVKKLSTINGIMFRIRSYIPPAIKLQIYYSLFYSHIFYCLLVYGTLTQTAMEKIVLQQKKFVRSIINAPRLEHTNPIFNNFKILKMKNLFDFKLSRCIHQSHKSSSKYLQLCNIRYSFLSSYNIRNVSTYSVPFLRQEYLKQSLAYRAPILLNNIPDEIQRCVSACTLKHKLKQHFLDAI